MLCSLLQIRQTQLRNRTKDGLPWLKAHSNTRRLLRRTTGWLAAIAVPFKSSVLPVFQASEKLPVELAVCAVEDYLLRIKLV